MGHHIILCSLWKVVIKWAWKELEGVCTYQDTTSWNVVNVGYANQKEVIKCLIALK